MLAEVENTTFDELRPIHLKNAIGVAILGHKKTQGGGMYLCSQVFVKNMRIPYQINKKTTRMFLDLYSLDKRFKLNPKYPNFYVEFESTQEVTDIDQFSSLFIKLDLIFFCSKVFVLSFFNTVEFPFFFYSFFSGIKESNSFTVYIVTA